MHDDIRILSAYYGEQCIRIDGNGGSDTSTADIDFVKISGAVMQGKSKQYYVFVLPIAEEVDLKVAAKTVGEKSVEMIHVKDITAITGYVRGGCTPLGMKKQFPTVLHDSARNFDKREGCKTSRRRDRGCKTRQLWKCTG